MAIHVGPVQFLTVRYQEKGVDSPSINLAVLLDNACEVLA